MPCYEAPETNTQIQSRKTCKLIIAFDKKLGIPTSPQIRKWSEAYFENHCDEVTPLLCAKIRNLTPEQLESVVYDAHCKDSRKLATWWEKHEEFDKSKEN